MPACRFIRSTAGWPPLLDAPFRRRPTIGGRCERRGPPGLPAQGAGRGVEIVRPPRGRRTDPEAGREPVGVTTATGYLDRSGFAHLAHPWRPDVIIRLRHDWRPDNRFGPCAR